MPPSELRCTVQGGEGARPGMEGRGWTAGAGADVAHCCLRENGTGQRGILFDLEAF